MKFAGTYIMKRKGLLLYVRHAGGQLCCGDEFIDVKVI